MPIIQREKFRQKDINKTKDVLGIDMGNFREKLTSCQYVLQQPKPSTAAKQLMEIGAKVILDSETGKFIEIVLDNIRKNERLGIISVKEEIKAKVKPHG